MSIFRYLQEQVVRDQRCRTKQLITKWTILPMSSRTKIEKSPSERNTLCSFDSNSFSIFLSSIIGALWTVLVFRTKDSTFQTVNVHTEGRETRGRGRKRKERQVKPRFFLFLDERSLCRSRTVAQSFFISFIGKRTFKWMIFIPIFFVVECY